MRRLELFIRHERVALLVAEEVVETGSRAVRGRVPIGPTGAARTDTIALRRWIGVWQNDRPAIGVDLLRPGDLRVRPSEQESTVGAIEDIEKAVAVRDCHQLPRRSGDRLVDQYGRVRGVPVVYVMRGELEVPFQPAGVGIECDQ